MNERKDLERQSGSSKIDNARGGKPELDPREHKLLLLYYSVIF
jgi:hypothetical protein